MAMKRAGAKGSADKKAERKAFGIDDLTREELKW